VEICDALPARVEWSETPCPPVRRDGPAMSGRVAADEALILCLGDPPALAAAPVGAHLAARTAG
jgi:hypothetical protein